MSEIIEKAIEEYKPKYIVGLFSGGHDSLTACHVALPYVDFVCHINTGFGIEQTRQFVRDTCKAWGVELREYKATENTKADGTPDPMIYENIVMENGFPGAYAHKFMYIMLKQRQIARMRRDLGIKAKEMMLITGARKEESKRRKINVTSPTQIDSTGIWVSPIWDYSKRQCNDYIFDHNIKRNIVVDNLHSSGECLCGAYAHKGELKEIRFWYPEVAKKIDELEKKVRANGFSWGWEEGPPDWWKWAKMGQLMFDELDGVVPMLCTKCDFGAAMEKLGR